MKKLTLDEAEKLAMETDYAIEAAEQEINPINIGDAGAFFLEGYNHAWRMMERLEREAKKERKAAQKESHEHFINVLKSENEDFYKPL